MLIKNIDIEDRFFSYLLYTDWSQLTEVLLVQEGDQLRENALG